MPNSDSEELRAELLSLLDKQLSGQSTLWNQQGSHVRRGALLVMRVLIDSRLDLQGSVDKFRFGKVVDELADDKYVKGAFRALATSKATGTPPRGRAST